MAPPNGKMVATICHGPWVLISAGIVRGRRLTSTVGIRDDVVNAPRTSHWFAVPAAAIIVLPLLGRRRWPFGAPAAVWAVAAACSFADGRLVGFTTGVAAAGWVAAYLLGNLRDASQAWMGLAVVLGGALIVVSNDPNLATGDVVFLPGKPLPVYAGQGKELAPGLRVVRARGESIGQGR